MEIISYYWFWKKKIKKIEDDDWIGFCAYRRFWFNNHQNEKVNFKIKFSTKSQKLERL